MLKNSEFEKNAFRNRRKVKYTEDFDVWIIGKEDLILSKLNWAKKTESERQLLDVASIIRNGYDEVYVSDWAKKLGVEDLLQESIELLQKNYDDGYNS